MAAMLAHVKQKIALLLGSVMCVQAVSAADFKAPERLVREDKVYKLKYQTVNPNGSAQYDYTTNDEPAEEWTTLVRIKYDRRNLKDLSKWVIFMDNSLERTVPKPVYSVYVSGEHGFARYVLDPIPTSPMYESNVFKNYYSNACGGFLVYQYSIKYPPAEDQSDAGRLAKLKMIVAENEKIANDIEEEAWIPSCQ